MAWRTGPWPLVCSALLCCSHPTPQGACPRPLVSGGLTDERCSVRIQSCRRASVQQLDGPLERACAALYQVSGPFLVLQAGQGLRARAIGRQSPAALPLPSLWRRTPRRTTLASLETRTAEPGGPRLLQPGRALLRLRAAGGRRSLEVYRQIALLQVISQDSRSCMRLTLYNPRLQCVPNFTPVAVSLLLGSSDQPHGSLLTLFASGM
jgi:hypothetical protein